MKVRCSSETSADFQRTTRRYITEDKTFYNHRCENLKSYKIINVYSIQQARLAEEIANGMLIYVLLKLLTGKNME
jgi:hypothetical protein